MNTTETAATTTTSPWERPPRRIYSDLILKEEFQERRLQLKPGQNWLRILPAHPKSIHQGWLLAVHSLNFKEGKFAHPKTLTPNASSAFDQAYAWLKKNKPQMLFSKEHPTGVRLLTDPVALCWVIADQGDRPQARIFQASGYDGSRGGTQGLGYQLWRMACFHETAPREYAPDAAHPDLGVQICIEKIQHPSAKYPTYRLQRAQYPLPIEDLMNKISEEESNIFCPIEQTVRELSAEEQWKQLATMIPQAVIDQIRNAAA